MRNADRPPRRVNCLQIVVLFLAVAGIMALARAESAPSAAAQIPDSGLQRKELLDEVRRTNELLARILERLEKGPLLVKPAPDKPATTPEALR